MSVAPDSLDAARFEKTRQQINALMEEVARLGEQDLSPPEFYGEFLQRVLAGIAAPAGAVWGRTPQGNLQLQFQIRMPDVFQPIGEEGRKQHDELLRQAAVKAQPYLLPPMSGPGAPGATGGDGATGATGSGATNSASNPTPYYCLIAPIMVDAQVAGLVEVWQDPNRHPQAQRGFLGYVVQMSNLAALFLRNHQLRHLSGQQQLWTQLETFARQVHGSLNPTEVAYTVATEGRRLVDCDRVSVAVKAGRKLQVEAVSGADVVERRSGLVQTMRALFEAVQKWGDRLVYAGTKDDSLPPNVLTALDAYLQESNSKLLVIQPLKDEREKEKEKDPKAKRRSVRSLLLMECFEPTATADQMIARLEVVGRHSAPALYNAVEHTRIPMRFIWAPLAKLQEGLGGKARAITLGVLFLLAVVGTILALPPSVVHLPGQVLKLDAKGQLLPRERRWIYSPVPGQVVNIADSLKPGATVQPDQALVYMYSSELETDLVKLDKDIEAAEKMIEAYTAALNTNDVKKNPDDRQRYITEHEQKKVERESKVRQRDELRMRVNADEQRPGYFWLRAPKATGGVQRWTVLNWDFRENLLGRPVKPSDQLLRLGNIDGQWEVDLKIPQKHIGQVRLAYVEGEPREDLDVDLLLMTKSHQTFHGKLARADINSEATPNKDDAGGANESEPVVESSTRIDGVGLPENDDYTIPRDYLLTGTEVHAKVRANRHPIGYSLFYGLWEFFYEKVVFWF